MPVFEANSAVRELEGQPVWTPRKPLEALPIMKTLRNLNLGYGIALMLIAGLMSALALTMISHHNYVADHSGYLRAECVGQIVLDSHGNWDKYSDRTQDFVLYEMCSIFGPPKLSDLLPKP